jgi:hypothetical protein
VTAKLGSGVHLNPEQAKHLPAAVHADFLNAFAHALHGVFLWGVAITVIPFFLSWALKEVPLRTSIEPAAEATVEEAPAGGTPDERILAAAAESSQ